MSTSKAKGTAFETATVNHFNDYGFEAERRALSGAQDKGDIVIPSMSVVLECKNAKAWNIAGWMDETLEEQRNAAAQLSFLIVKRPRKGVQKAYVIMELDQLCYVLNKLYPNG